MAIEFTNLVSPDQLTTSLSILISFILFIFGTIGYKLKNPAILFFWMMTIIVLIFTFITNLEFLWFWITVMLTSVVISITSIIRFIID